MRGTARALDSAKLVNPDRVAQLEVQALEGAVESAMRGAPDVLQLLEHPDPRYIPAHAAMRDQRRAS